MKAIRIHERGGPEQLIYEDAPKPVPGRGDAVVRVVAAGVTPTELSWPSAYTNRDSVDRLPAIPGHEFSGVVDVPDPVTTDVSAGEAVYALADFWRDGSDADYIAIAALDLAPKPRTLDFTQAAAVPLSALTAWQALFDDGRLAAGQKVLIHGATGGVGTSASPVGKTHMLSGPLPPQTTHKSRLVSSGWSMSALPPIADIRRCRWDVRKVPSADAAQHLDPSPWPVLMNAPSQRC